MGPEDEGLIVRTHPLEYVFLFCQPFYRILVLSKECLLHGFPGTGGGEFVCPSGELDTPGIELQDVGFYVPDELIASERIYYAVYVLGRESAYHVLEQTLLDQELTKFVCAGQVRLVPSHQVTRVFGYEVFKCLTSSYPVIGEYLTCLFYPLLSRSPPRPIVAVHAIGKIYQLV